MSIRNELGRFVAGVRIPIKERIEASIRIEPTGCWIWLRAKNNKGYGGMHVGARGRQLVHRLAYETWIGVIPKGMFVCHRCDVPLCVNPDHLFLGTQRENMLDCKRKGRTYHNGAKNPRRGEQHHSTSLTEDIVRRIRLDTRTQRAIASEYGVSPSAVSNIKHGISWKHVQ